MKRSREHQTRQIKRCCVWLLAALLSTTLLMACSGPVPGASGQSDDIHKIKHVVVIMQENRSFDTYFGTFPGADGIPMQNGTPTVCVPDPRNNQCVKPFHDPNDLNNGGPHGQVDATNDINGGKMDGFIRQELKGRKTG